MAESRMRIHRSEKGQGLLEYAVIIVFLAIAVMVSLSFLGSGLVGAIFNNIIINL